MRFAALSTLLAAGVSLACAGPSPTATRAPAERAPASLSIHPDTAVLRGGDTLRLHVVARDSAGAEIPGLRVRWSTSDSARATVSAAGTVTGMGVGPVTITASGGGRVTDAHLRVVDRRPSFIVIVTDDQAMSDFEHMPRTRELLGRRGTTFTNFFVTTPNCCPSRASIFRGQYAHNHQVYNNGPSETGGFGRFHRLGHENATIATSLQGAGYRTALVGKYLNIYPGGVVSPSYVPPGWTDWNASIQGSEFNFFGYTLANNGRPRAYGNAPEDYQADVLSARGAEVIRAASGAGQPFFLYIGPFAPHEPATPAPRHQGMFAGVSAPRPPSFNEADVSDKPRAIRQLRPLDAAAIDELDELYRERLRSLQSVDDMVGALVDTLAATGALENTYIFFTSDNGFHMGQHRLSPGKKHPYEEDIRVGLLVRGPGVPAGRVAEELAATIDLAPTLAALAGVALEAQADGRSLVPLLHGQAPATWRRSLLAEMWVSGLPTTLGWEALRTRDYTYVERGAERELYHLPSDPYQLQSLHATADPALLESFARRLAALRGCVGAACRAAEEQP